MSVIVKGMDMPTECRECPFAKFGIMSGETYCWVNGVTLAKNFEVISFDGRPDWCPLVALPDHHGRLVDADAMCNDLVTVDQQFEQMVEWCISVAEAQPTIVEAEDET